MKFKRFDELFFGKEAIFLVTESIERRLSEFVQLWALLERIYPSQVIPPLPEISKDPIILETLLNLSVEAVLDHPILREDEYFNSFMEVEEYADVLPMIKNVEAPVETKREYFKRTWRMGGSEMAKDNQFKKVQS